MAENSCRHFLGMFPDSRPQCAMGRNVREWGKRCNGGSSLGIGLRLPCTRQADDAGKPLFDCPELDRRTDQEVEASRVATLAKMDRLIASMSTINAIRVEMIEANTPERKTNCPFCGGADCLSVSVAIGINNHIRAACSACGEGFIE